MQRKKSITVILSLGSLLGITSCSEQNSSSTLYDPNYAAPRIAQINDPLLSQQWYLKNTRQNSFATYGGKLGEDIQAFANGSSVSDYAQGMTGRGVQVAVIDTGLEIGHEDLTENVVPNGSYNFVSDSNGLGLHDPSPTQSEDHGTSVGGLLAARGGNGKGIWGTAPAASLRGFNLLQTNLVSAEFASLGYEDSVVNYPELTSSDVAIFNRSYGSNPYQSIPETDFSQVTQPIMDAIRWGAQNLRQGKGAIYVKAGGNEFTGGGVFPLGWCDQAEQAEVTCYNVTMETENNSPFEIVVGAFNADGKRSSYSNTGSALWISAPGGEFGQFKPALLSTDMSGCDKGFSQSPNPAVDNAFNKGEVSSNRQCDYFSAFNGSSGATPIVSGVVALMLEANPELTAREVKHIMALTARQIDPQLSRVTMTLNGQNVVLEQGWQTSKETGIHFSNAYGFGAVDVQAAVAMAKAWKQSQKHLAPLQEIAPISAVFDTPKEVPDADPQGISDSLNVSQSGKVETVTVHLTIKASNTSNGYPAMDNSDYQILLTSPSGTTSILLTPFNAYQSGYEMDDLMLTSNAFYGEDLSGDWTLTVKDLDGSTNNRIAHPGLGKLTKWSIEFTARDQ